MVLSAQTACTWYNEVPSATVARCRPCRGRESMDEKLSLSIVSRGFPNRTEELSETGMRILNDQSTSGYETDVADMSSNDVKDQPQALKCR